MEDEAKADAQAQGDIKVAERGSVHNAGADEKTEQRGEGAAATRGVLIWHRRDLRLRDNSLYDGLCMEGRATEGIKLVCVYVFDDGQYERRQSLVSPEWEHCRTGTTALTSTRDIRGTNASKTKYSSTSLLSLPLPRGSLHCVKHP
jgi:hypothetical protein